MTIPPATATTLDGIYGEGTAAKFTSLMQSIGMNSKITSSPALTTVLQNPLANGRGVAVEVTWRVGGNRGALSTALRRDRGRLHGLGRRTVLSGQGHPHAAGRKVGAILGVYRSHSAHDGDRRKQRSGETLKSVGFGPLSHGGWGTVIPSPTAQEYTKWVNEGSPPATEPAWRKALGPVGPSVF